MSIKLCPTCITPITKKRNKFCSRSCAASYNNRNTIRSKESNDKRREKLLGKTRKTIETFICKECNKDFTFYRKSSYRPKFCSTECRAKSMSKSSVISGKLSAQSRKLRSKDEIMLFNLCEEKFNNVKSNHIITNGWDADIVLPDHMIAILWNGPWHYKEMGIKGHSLKQVQNRDRIKTKLFISLGWKVLVYEDRYFTPKQALEDLSNVIMVSGTGIEPV